MRKKIDNKIKAAYQNIKLWSTNNQAAREILRSDLGLREWDHLTKE